MLRNFLASLFGFIFLIFSIPFFLFYGLFGTLDDEQIYLNEGVDLAYDILLLEVPTLIDIEEFAALDEDDIAKLIQNVISKGDFRDFVDSALSSIKKARIADDYKLIISIPLDLLTLKRDDLAAELTDLFYKKLPACDYELDYLKFSDGKSPECIPPNFAKADFKFEVGTILDKVVFADLPSQFVLDLNVPYKFDGTASDFFGKIKLFILLILSFFSLFTISVMALIIWSPWLKILKSTSLTLFLSSFLVIFYCLLLLIAPLVFENKLANEFVNAETFSAYLSFYNFMVLDFFKNVLIFALPVLILALGIFIFTLIISKRKIHDAS